ncbi:hypothetical protein HC028_15790 [Planosporangium flavigriseum]|nr:hypothetical protein [Planosporangium flavigriseum]
MALVLLVVVIAVVQLTRSSGGDRPAAPGGGVGAPTPGDAPAGGAPAPGGLPAAPMNGTVTGQVPTDCRVRNAANGQPLPDPTCTPGVISTEVTQDNLSSTICRSGYTKTVRPPQSQTGAFKRKVMVAYHQSGPLGEYELDHLISLQLGGSNDAGNLWPQYNDRPGRESNSKDPVETALNRAVCSHRITLAAAQAAIATDWTTALARLGLPPVGSAPEQFAPVD